MLFIRYKDFDTTGDCSDIQLLCGSVNDRMVLLSSCIRLGLGLGLIKY